MTADNRPISFFDGFCFQTAALIIVRLPYRGQTARRRKSGGRGGGRDRRAARFGRAGVCTAKRVSCLSNQLRCTSIPAGLLTAMVRLSRWIISSIAEQLNKSRYCNGLLKMWQAHLPPKPNFQTARPFRVTILHIKTRRKSHEPAQKNCPNPCCPTKTRRDIQARESYHVLKIISEFVEAAKNCAPFSRPSAFTAARARPKTIPTTRSHCAWRANCRMPDFP